MSHPAHHEFGPSSLKRRLNCLASYQAEAGAPDKESEYALLGTAAHKLAEQCRNDDKPAKTYLGMTIDVRRIDGSFKEFIVDQNMVDSVQEYIDHVNSLPGVDFNEQLIRYEEDVPGEWFAHGYGGFGTLDAARGNDGVTYIRDFKHGEGVKVYARDNDQLLGCALGFYRTWGHLFDIQEFDLGICQPRLDHLDTWRVSLDYVLEWARLKLTPGVEHAVKTPLAELEYRAGDWCQFCKIKEKCKARAEAQFAKALGDSGFSDLDDALDQSVLGVKQPGQYSNEELERIVLSGALSQLRKWASDIERYVWGETAAGRTTLTKLVGGKNARVWKQTVDVRAKLLEQDGVTEDHLYLPREMRSVSQMEQALGKKLFTPPKLDAEGNVKKEAGPLYDLFDKVPGKPKIVSVDDPRPAVVVSADQEFDEVEGDE